MFEEDLAREQLERALLALERIPVRFEGIEEPDDFVADDTGRERLDSICMVLLAVGETLRQIDTKTRGDWRTRFPQIPWAGVIGMRNLIAHGYFEIDHEQVYGICQNEIPSLIRAFSTVIAALKEP